MRDSPNYVEEQSERGMVEELLADIDTAFEVNGAGDIPHWVRYFLVAQFITCPIWLLGLLYCLGAFEDPPQKKPSKKCRMQMEEERIR